ncbi:MAG TPA: hypothetical protein VK256_09315 [Candidatus Eisenbacteria bacterium]|nr:hypothetical protein [Candidatus Eisenbacteria bacterium]
MKRWVIVLVALIVLAMLAGAPAFGPYSMPEPPPIIHSNLL